MTTAGEPLEGAATVGDVVRAGSLLLLAPASAAFAPPEPAVDDSGDWVCDGCGGTCLDWETRCFDCGRGRGGRKPAPDLDTGWAGSPDDAVEDLGAGWTCGSCGAECVALEARLPPPPDLSPLLSLPTPPRPQARCYECGRGAPPLAA